MAAKRKKSPAKKKKKAAKKRKKVTVEQTQGRGGILRCLKCGAALGQEHKPNCEYA